MADGIILDYHNSLLRKSDLKLLQYPNWLNDNIISFVYEYLEYDKYSDYNSKVAFVGPDTVQFMKLGNYEDIAPCIESLQLAEKEFLFFAINDSDTENGGGSHWSLLLFIKKGEEFHHFDSWTGNNEPAARALAKALKPHLKLSNILFKTERCPQQQNGCDCGMYVICFTQSLAEHYLSGKQLGFEIITPDYIKQLRIKWTETIYNLAKGLK